MLISISPALYSDKNVDINEEQLTGCLLRKLGERHILNSFLNCKKQGSSKQSNVSLKSYIDHSYLQQCGECSSQ